eukprot:scaffold14052_cov83-Skeletonema_marinoi.AAC.1
MTIPNLAHELPEPKAFIFDDLNSSILHRSMAFPKEQREWTKIPFKRDYTRPDVCPVLAALRNSRRAITLNPINILRPWIYQIEIYLLSRQQTASVCVL